MEGGAEEQPKNTRAIAVKQRKATSLSLREAIIIKHKVKLRKTGGGRGKVKNVQRIKIVYFSIKVFQKLSISLIHLLFIILLVSLGKVPKKKNSNGSIFH